MNLQQEINILNFALHMKVTSKKLRGKAPLLANPPIGTPLLGDIHPYHFTLLLLLNQSWYFLLFHMWDVPKNKKHSLQKSD